MVQVMNFLARRSPHFVIRYLPSSFAEGNLVQITARLEGAWAVISDLLKVESDESISVTLIDDMVVSGDSRRQTGLVRPKLREIREVYRPDVPGPGLERSLLLVALAGTLTHPPVPFLIDGLQACVAARLPGATVEDPTRRLQQAARTGGLPPLVGLFPGPRPATQAIYVPAARSFVGYLLRTFGPGRFKHFVDLLIPGHGPEAAQSAFGCSLKSLEHGWRKDLGARIGGGIGRFLKLVVPYLRPYRLKIVEILIYILIAVAFNIGLARTQGLLLDKALIPGDTHALLVIMAALAIAFVVTILAQVRTMYLVAFISENVLRDLRLRMFALVQRLDPGFFRQMSTGDILTRMSADLDQVQSGIPIVLAQGVRMVLTVVAAVIIVFTLNWKLACLSLMAIPILVLTGRLFGPRAAEASVQRQRKLAASITTLQENLATQPIVKAFSLEDWAQRRYAGDLVGVFRSAVRLTFISGTSGATFASVGSFFQLTVMGLGGYLVVQRQLTPGSLIAFLALTAQVIGPMQNLSSVLQSVQQASGGMERVNELLQAEPVITDTEDARILGRLADGIRVEDVTFAYTSGETVLRHVSVDIAVGTTLAVVGPSGSGKSTLLNMLIRFYDPAQGGVRFDGVDIRQATLHSLRGQIGLVLQDNVLFNISIRENIRLGSTEATDEEVEAAARHAEIHESIMEMPAGYDTVVGESGGELSGGQRQRVAIARAMIRNPSILLLDEATSALDARTEVAINDTLERIGTGRTTINVTHRVDRTINADHILVMDHGAVVEEGNHVELLKRGGLYSILWDQQMGIMGGDGRSGLPQLRTIPIFSGLPPQLLSTVAKQLHVQRYRAGDIIVEPAGTIDDMFIIGKGEVEVLVDDSAGGQRRLAVLHEGDHFGEMALLHGAPRVATVRAKTPVSLYVLGKQELTALLAADPELRDTFERIITERNHQAVEAAGSHAGKGDG